MILKTFRIYNPGNFKIQSILKSFHYKNCLLIVSGKEFKFYDNVHILDKSLLLKKDKNNILYIGKGKQGFTKPWNLLFEIVKKNRDIEWFILSDADNQYSKNILSPLKLDSNVDCYIPCRKKKKFGEFTFERVIIEEIENSFVRYKVKTEISDFQPGLYILNRRVVDKISFNSIRKFKWIGDLFLIENLVKNKFNIKEFSVKTSNNHNSSTVFDYKGPLEEMLMGIPLIKLKELVEYYGIRLSELKKKILNNKDKYLHYLKNINSNNEFDLVNYVSYIINFYIKTAQLYNIKI